MLTFDGVWPVGEDESWSSLFRADGRQRVWVRRLLWPMAAVGLRCGQVYVMDSKHRWMHRDTVMRSWGSLLCRSSTTTSCCSMIAARPHVEGAVHNSWELNTSQFLRGQHLAGHVAHWACLGCSGYDSVFQFLQHPATSHSHWRGVDQHSTGHNQQPDQLCVKEMWDKCWSHRYWLVLKTEHFRVACYCGSLRHTCAIFMLSDQPHLWGGWIISAEEKCSLTQI